ncbi:hypothetical protein BDR06DRAFT_45456 [Suillus hirtellus]|nr:hypothetical protein BDR06DRAFT_45456 [Suillus hirtellus]
MLHPRLNIHSAGGRIYLSLSPCTEYTMYTSLFSFETLLSLLLPPSITCTFSTLFSYTLALGIRAQELRRRLLQTIEEDGCRPT